LRGHGAGSFGQAGIDQANADAFFAECAALDAWHRRAEADRASILPAGDATAAAAAAARVIRPKVDDYFGRCRLAAFDPRAIALLNRKEEEYYALAAQDLSIDAAEIAGFPLAQVAAGKALPLGTGINPAHAAAIADVERLLRYTRDLYLLCTNFVSFRDFYDAGEPAIFQAGTLFLDQRSCTLTLQVEDVGRHAAMAGLAGSYLAYCDCERRGTGEKRQIVAAFTNGESDNLMVGRNGLFYDRKGNDWDATIIKLIENPISVRQAFWSPYKKLVRKIEEQVAKRAAARTRRPSRRCPRRDPCGRRRNRSARAGAEEGGRGRGRCDGSRIRRTGHSVRGPGRVPLGLLKLPFWQVCLAAVGVMLLVSGPSMVIAWLKLRKRNSARSSTRTAGR
jgi:hypothetical protein